MTRYLLTCPQALFSRLTESDDPSVEHLAYDDCGVSRYGDHVEFLLREVQTLDESDYVSRSAGLVRTSHESTWKAWEQAGEDYAALVSCHSHTCTAFFSDTDNRHDGRVWRNVLDFCPHYIRMVAGTDGVVAQVISRENSEWTAIDEIKVVGPGGMKIIFPKNGEIRTDPKQIDGDLQDRTLRLGPGAKQALDAIHGSNFAFLGAGGGNSIASQFLKFLCPKRMIFIDADKIERHNANRFLGYRFGDEGILKGETLTRETSSSHPEIETMVIAERFPNKNTIEALKQSDVIVSFPDNDPTRYDLSLFAARYHKPVFDAGTLIGYPAGDHQDPTRITARILTQFPGGPCLFCLGVEGGYSSQIEDQVRASQASYSNRPDLGPAPQIITTNALAASFLIRNILAWFYPGLTESVPSYLQFEELLPAIENLSSLFPRNPECPICGDSFVAERGWGDLSPAQKGFIQPPKAT
ncbi:MAG: ThiF family adenylyltransferase [Candidatus Omnitrophica bacterium]|nr:ThiF family adenylyltransferase [Candidatus Omnitrophota bacterium]